MSPETDHRSEPESSTGRLTTVWRGLVVVCGLFVLIWFGIHWTPGLVLDFFRKGTPFDRMALALVVILFFPPLIERIHLPGVIALIFAGVLLGPDGLAVAPRSGPVGLFFADLGRVFLMFLAGLEINMLDFRARAGRSALFGASTFVVPLAAGILVGRLFGYGWNASVLIGSLMASHTLLGYPVMARLGLVRAEVTLVTVGATIFTDIASLLVLAMCVSVHTIGFSWATLDIQLAELAIYCVLVLGGIPWVGERFLRAKRHDEEAQALFILLALVVASIGAKLINLEDIVGAFLCGLAVNGVLEPKPVREKIELLGKALFVPMFFIMIGVRLDLPKFVSTLQTEYLLVLGIVGGLILSKLLAALVPKVIFGYRWPEAMAMWSLSLPQVAATLAAALVAYETVNPAGERLIDEPVLNTVIVLMVVTSLLGPILTERAGERMGPAGLRSA